MIPESKNRKMSVEKLEKGISLSPRPFRIRVRDPIGFGSETKSGSVARPNRVRV